MNLITEILSDYRAELGVAFTAYHNHAQRVFYLAKILDRKNEIDNNKLAIACAFHDLGIWSNNTWDYLKPSEGLCEKYLKENSLLDIAEELRLMIHHHHKLTRYSGKHKQTVELFRKADLVDFSGGLIRFGVSKAEYKTLSERFPQKGFHAILFSKFRNHFLLRPWNPFPMVKF